jgi:hypothetical protein
MCSYKILKTNFLNDKMAMCPSPSQMYIERLFAKKKCTLKGARRRRGAAAWYFTSRQNSNGDPVVSCCLPIRTELVLIPLKLATELAPLEYMK